MAHFELFSYQSFILLVAAILAGMFNGIAGGGSFISFPALIITGLTTVEANATSTVALWFGAFASTMAYRHALLGKPKSTDAPPPPPPPAVRLPSIQKMMMPPSPSSSPSSSIPIIQSQPQPPGASEVIDQKYIYGLSGASLGGGIIGSCLLLVSSDKTFGMIVPYLMVLATSLFAFSPRITKWLRSKNNNSGLPFVGALGLQFVIAIYGGYFGGGVSIMMLAAMNFMGFTNVHAMNGLKSLLGNCMNGVAIVAFIIAQKIAWPAAILMGFGAVLGAYISAQIAQKISQQLVRNFIVGIACAMTAYLFGRQWGMV
jgi:uncharacterized protein